MLKPKVGKAYRLGWWDHLLVGEAWCDAEKHDKEVSCECYSYGVLIKEDPIYYTFAGSMAIAKNADGSIDSISHGDVNRIMKAAVFEVKEIK